jgi:hypothetical protein
LPAGVTKSLVSGSPRAYCQLRLPGATIAAASTGEPSLQAVGVLGPDCHLGFQEHSPEALLQAGGTKPADLGQLSWSSESFESCLHRGASFPVLVSHFIVKVTGWVVGGVWSSQFLCV